jgi:hypothetical protein
MRRSPGELLIQPPNNATEKETISRSRMVMLTDMRDKSLKNRWRYHPCLAIRKERRSSLCSILIELIVSEWLRHKAPAKRLSNRVLKTQRLNSEPPGHQRFPAIAQNDAPTPVILSPAIKPAAAVIANRSVTLGQR